MLGDILVLIRGAGDLATGVAVSLHKCGMKVIMTEIAQPRAIRRTVTLAEAIYEGQMEVEGVRAMKAAGFQEAEEILRKGHIPIFVDEKGEAIAHFRPEVVVDATMAKRNRGTHLDDARIVIALGPGFTAGEDVHAVIETMRGHYLGRVIFDGRAMDNTGIPADIQGYGRERVLRAPTKGKVRTLKNIGEMVKKGEIVAYVDGQPVRAGVSGVIRGMIKSGIEVEEDLKIGDVDPRGVREYCYTISDKSRAIGRAVLEAIFILLRR
jgi:xanthine dehydrogenase accessory factor